MTSPQHPSSFKVAGYQGVGVNVWDYGGQGPPLVLLHCTGTHGRIWDPLVPSFADTFHVYSVDTRGHGDSDKPDAEAAYTWANSGRDLECVVRAIAPKKPVSAVGHSAGAAHICYAALRDDSLFSRAVLIDPIIGPREFFQSPNGLAEGARRRRNRFESRDAARDRFAAKPPMNAWDSAVLSAYVDHGLADTAEGDLELKCPGRIEGAIYDRGGSSDIFDSLSRIAFPKLLMTGEHSDVRHLAEAQRQQFRDAEFVVVPGASHFIPQEQPAEVARIVHDWLAAA